MTDLTEKTLATERKYTGKIISVDLLDIELPDGRRAKREVIRHGNAVAIIARRPDGKFIFVRQYRKAAEEALIEAIAGGLEPGEDPVEGAKRETAEETGYEVTGIKFLTTIICTPGYCEERIHLYFAELSGPRRERLPRGPLRGGGRGRHPQRHDLRLENPLCLALLETCEVNAVTAHHENGAFSVHVALRFWYNLRHPKPKRSFPCR